MSESNAKPAAQEPPAGGASAPEAPAGPAAALQRRSGAGSSGPHPRAGGAQTPGWRLPTRQPARLLVAAAAYAVASAGGFLLLDQAFGAGLVRLFAVMLAAALIVPLAVFAPLPRPPRLEAPDARPLLHRHRAAGLHGQADDSRDDG